MRASCLAGAVLCAFLAATAPARAETITARDLATLREISSLSVSPDGKWVAFQIVQADPERNSHDTAWFVMPTRSTLGSGNGPRRLAEAGAFHPGGPLGFGGVIGSYRPAPPPVWSADSEWLAYLRWHDHGAQLWRIRKRGGRAEQLTHGDAHVRALAYARDGTRILYETEPSLAQRNTAVLAEGLNGLLFDGRFLPAYDHWPVFPADSRFAPGTSERRSDALLSARRIWTYELAVRRERLATQAEQAEFRALVISPRPASLIRSMLSVSLHGARAWTEARDPQRQGIEAPLTVLVQPRADGEPVVCDVPECVNQPIRNLWWRNDEELIFSSRGPRQTREGFETLLYSWRLGEAGVRPILRTSGRLTAHVGAASSTCTIAADRLLCIYEEAAAPGRIVAIDLDSGAIETLYDPNPGFARFDLGAPRQLEFRAPSGTETYYGILVLPPDYRAQERLSLVMVAYNCDGFLRGSNGDEYPIYVFAAEGHAVLCMDQKEDDERKARVDQRTYNRWAWGPGVPARRLVLDGFAAALALLVEMQLIDPDRVGVVGQSRSAQMAAWAIAGMPRLAAAITSGPPGVGGPTTYYLAAADAAEHLEDQYQLGSPVATPARWRELSLSLNAGQVRAALLINAPDHELMDTLEPVVALRDAGRAVEMYVYPNEYHWKWQPAHRLAIYSRNIDWMNFWLRGREDPAPEKSEQYKRWRAMRVKQCELFKGDDAPWYCRQSFQAQ